MTVDRPDPWYADLPELDDRGRQVVLDVLLDVLVYRNVSRDDVRGAYEIAVDPAAVLAEQALDDRGTPPYTGPTGGRYDDPTSPNPWDWPDGPPRRRQLGHQDEPDVPAYCTCGELTDRCPARPREWRNPNAGDRG